MTTVRRYVDNLIICSIERSNVSSIKDFIVYGAPELVFSSTAPVNGKIEFLNLTFFLKMVWVGAMENRLIHLCCQLPVLTWR